MKKLLISIVLTLLTILACYLIFSNVIIFSWRSSSVKDIKLASEELDTKINESVQLNDQEYPNKIETLENSITTLKKAKEKYENKMKYLEENAELGVVEIKQYKIERLWIVLENYAKDEGIDLQLDIVETSNRDVYDLNVTVGGEYIGITDFIYDIEKDDTLGFKILNFNLQPYTTISETTEIKEEEGKTKLEKTTTASMHVDKLIGTFKIENVGIDFD